MKENSFELSLEKTCLMHFNNGENPKSLPQIKPWDGQLLNYKQNTVGGGGGVNWNLHIEKVITKARKRPNFQYI